MSCWDFTKNSTSKSSFPQHWAMYQKSSIVLRAVPMDFQYPFLALMRMVPSIPDTDYLVVEIMAIHNFPLSAQAPLLSPLSD